ncbi:agamous-like MADS-box protein AGL29 [Cajanus cajan]|uniref:Agamous-like MADS-box protein AGL62 n=1 Tax=Cajanus cajan TaxID=3821 RepID=A0A151T3N9_CAJCA|nr:agamous-like MADS-box protein AGL29 [Cajanus cajan]KYP61662.1 Agamous-like MADS-box protein AGL62 [Cajanus cajan]
MGRRKIEIKEVKDPNTKQVTFSKRRTGLFRKANELSILCGIEIAIIVFSPGNKPYSFGHPSVDAVTAKFLQQEPKSNNEVGHDIDMETLNKQLFDVQAQIRKEQKKAAKLDARMKQHKVTQLSHQQLKDSFSELQYNVKDYIDAIEVSECMMLLAKEPVVGIKKQVSKKK